MGKKKYLDSPKVWGVHETNVNTIRGLVTWCDTRAEARDLKRQLEALKLKRTTALSVSPLVYDQLRAMLDAGNMARPLPVWPKDRA